jgi:phenylacetate-CoA ligase
VIFEPKVESLPREQLRALQAERLRALVAYVKERVPHYRERLVDNDAGDISSVDDLRRLPFTRKDDLRDSYPFGMFAVGR